MRSRTWIIAGLAAAAVIVAAAVTVDHLPGRSTAEGSTTTSSHSSTAPSPSSNTPGAPVTSSPAPTPGGESDGPPQSKRFTTEVIPGAAGKALPKSTALPEPVSNPLPKTASAVGALAKGYPTSLLPATPHSSIGTSSVASQGQHLQVSLTATSTMTVTEVLAFYRTTLAKYGMYDTASPALGGATALTFKRGVDAVTITTSPVTDGTQYVIYGAFTAKN
ncbi:hypothetical protein ACPPVQ_17820 [Diaminobutyricibacter sp. McL0618]|uniref:hypothetical protein n=1 Tax=Leifsonia sp. McL0618 TaxID=3415677 RepID=UPI003CED0AEE